MAPCPYTISLAFNIQKHTNLSTLLSSAYFKNFNCFSKHCDALMQSSIERERSLVETKEQKVTKQTEANN